MLPESKMLHRPLIAPLRILSPYLQTSSSTTTILAPKCFVVSWSFSLFLTPPSIIVSLWIMFHYCNPLHYALEATSTLLPSHHNSANMETSLLHHDAVGMYDRADSNAYVV